MTVNRAWRLYEAKKIKSQKCMRSNSLPSYGIFYKLFICYLKHLFLFFFEALNCLTCDRAKVLRSKQNYDYCVGDS